MSGGDPEEFIRILVVGWIFTPSVRRNSAVSAAAAVSRVHCEEGNFISVARPFVTALAPAASLSLEGTTVPTRLIASFRPRVHIFPEPIKTLRFPGFFFLHFETRNILLRTEPPARVRRAQV